LKEKGLQYRHVLKEEKGIRKDVTVCAEGKHFFLEDIGRRGTIRGGGLCGQEKGKTLPG